MDLYRFTLGSFEQNCGLILLYHTSIHPDKPDWPSWAPDFSIRPRLAHLSLTGIARQFDARVKAVYNAAGSTNLYYNLRSNPDELAIYGVEVDIVDRVVED